MICGRESLKTCLFKKVYGVFFIRKNNFFFSEIFRIWPHILAREITLFNPGYFLDILLEIPYNRASSREKVTIFIRYSGLKKWEFSGVFASYYFDET